MKKFVTILLLSLSLFLVVSPIPVFAQQDWGGCVENNVATLRCIPVVFHNVVNAALMFVGAVSAVFIVYGGFKMINSGGDVKQVTEARRVITYAILGIVLVLSSFAIIYFIGYTTKSSDCITNIDQMANGGCK